MDKRKLAFTDIALFHLLNKLWERNQCRLVILQTVRVRKIGMNSVRFHGCNVEELEI